MFPAEDVGRGEVAKAVVTLPFSLVPKRNVASVPGLQLGYGGDRGPEPTCLPSWGWLPSNFPFALGPGGETVRNELETYACNLGCVLRGQETVGSRLVAPRLCLPFWKKVRDG